MQMKKLLAVILAALLPLAFMAPSSAGGVTVEPTVEVVGGRVSPDGNSAVINVNLTCPKGDAFSADLQMNFAEIGRDDTYTSMPTYTGTCTGKRQKLRLTQTAYYNPPIPSNCSAEYFLTIYSQSGGWALIANGPNLCIR